MESGGGGGDGGIFLVRVDVFFCGVPVTQRTGLKPTEQSWGSYILSFITWYFYEHERARTSTNEQNMACLLLPSKSHPANSRAIYIKRYRDIRNIDSVVLATEPQTSMLCAQLH